VVIIVPTTPYSATLVQGSKRITMPSSVNVGGTTYIFDEWEDYSTNPVRVVSLTQATAIHANYQPLTQVTIEDDFNDNSQNTLRWQTHLFNTASIAETNNRLECTVSDQYAKAGYISQSQYDLTNDDIKVDYGCVAAQTCELAISLGKGLGDGEIWDQNDFYIMRKLRTPTNQVIIVSRTGGGTPSYTAYNSSGTTGSLKIELSGSNINFYENDGLVHSESYALSSPIVYIWLYADAGDTYTGTNWFDNVTSYTPDALDLEPRLITRGMGVEGTFLVSQGFGARIITTVAAPPVLTRGYGGVTGTWIISQGFGSRKPRLNIYDIDILLKKINLQTALDIDTRIQLIDQQQSLNIDLQLLTVLFDEDFDIDTRLQRVGQLQNFDIDSVMQAIAQEQAFNIDIDIGAKQTVFDIDLRIFGIKRFTELDIDARVRKLDQLAFDIDMMMDQAYFESFDIDMIPKIIGTSELFNIDIVLDQQNPYVVIPNNRFFDPDVTGMYTTATIELRNFWKLFDIDVQIQKLAVQQAFSIDVDLAGWAVFNELFNIDLQLQKIATSELFDIDLKLYERFSESFDIDALLLASGDIVSFRISTQLQKLGLTQSFDADLQVAITGIETLLDIDIQTQINNQQTAMNIDFKIAYLTWRLMDIDMLVFKRIEDTFNLDAIVTIYGEKIFDIDMDIRKRIEELFDIDTIIKLYTEKIMDVDIAVLKKQETSGDIDVVLFKTSVQRNLDIDMQVQKTGIPKVFDIDVFPYNYSFNYFDIDVRIVRNYGQYIKGIMRFKNARGELRFL
jgi:hypothetical protein